MPILKRQVSFSLNFESLFSFMKDNFYVLFSSNNIYFAQKEPIQVKVLETFECSCQNLSNSFCQFWNGNLIPVKILYPYSTSWELAQTIYMLLLKRSTLKWKFLSLSSIRIKICQFLMSTLKWHHSSLSWQITPLWILSSYLFNFGLKDPIKIAIFRLSSALVKCAIFLMSFSKSQVIWK